jgi:hypothetical protein
MDCRASLATTEVLGAMTDETIFWLNSWFVFQLCFAAASL